VSALQQTEMSRRRTGVWSGSNQTWTNRSRGCASLSQQSTHRRRGIQRRQRPAAAIDPGKFSLLLATQLSPYCMCFKHAYWPTYYISEREVTKTKSDGSRVHYVTGFIWLAGCLITVRLPYRVTIIFQRSSFRKSLNSYAQPPSQSYKVILLY